MEGHFCPNLIKNEFWGLDCSLDPDLVTTSSEDGTIRFYHNKGTY